MFLVANLIEVVVFYLARDYDAAVEQGEKTIDLYAQSVGACAWLGPAYEKQGSSDRSAAAYRFQAFVGRLNARRAAVH